MINTESNLHSFSDVIHSTLLWQSLLWQVNNQKAMYKKNHFMYSELVLKLYSNRDMSIESICVQVALVHLFLIQTQGVVTVVIVLRHC